MTLTEIGRLAHEIARAKGHYSLTPALSWSLCWIQSEISDAFEAYRDGDLAMRFDNDGKPVGLPSELADIIIQVCDLCTHLGIDLDAAVAAKMAFSETRPMGERGSVP